MIEMLKSLRTLGDPYFARLELWRSSLFRDENHDLPRGGRLTFLALFIQCYSSAMNIAQYELVFWHKTPRFPKHNEVHVCDLLRERCTGFPCDERSSSWIAQQNGCQIDNNQRRPALL